MEITKIVNQDGIPAWYTIRKITGESGYDSTPDVSPEQLKELKDLLNKII